MLEVFSFPDGLDSRDRPIAALWEERAGVFRVSETHLVAYIPPVAGKWHLSFGDIPIRNITHWMPLPEWPKRSVVV